MTEPKWYSRYSDYATGWANLGSSPGTDKGDFSKCRDRLHGPHSPLFNGQLVALSRRGTKKGRAANR